MQDIVRLFDGLEMNAAQVERVKLLKKQMTGLALMPANKVETCLNQILNDTDDEIRQVAGRCIDRILHHWMAIVSPHALSVFEEPTRVHTAGERHKYLLNRKMNEQASLWELQGILFFIIEYSLQNPALPGYILLYVYI